jgi:hypothetical protein
MLNFIKINHTRLLSNAVFALIGVVFSCFIAVITGVPYTPFTAIFSFTFAYAVLTFMNYSRDNFKKE